MGSIGSLFAYFVCCPVPGPNTQSVLPCQFAKPQQLPHQDSNDLLGTVSGHRCTILSTAPWSFLYKLASGSHFGFIPLFFCNQFPKEQPQCSAHHLLSHTAPSILHKGMELLVWVKCLPSGLERSANQYPYGASRTGKLVAAAILHLRRSAVSQGHP